MLISQIGLFSISRRQSIFLVKIFICFFPWKLCPIVNFTTRELYTDYPSTVGTLVDNPTVPSLCDNEKKMNGCRTYAEYTISKQVRWCACVCVWWEGGRGDVRTSGRSELSSADFPSVSKRRTINGLYSPSTDHDKTKFITKASFFLFFPAVAMSFT